MSVKPWPLVALLLASGCAGEEADDPEPCNPLAGQEAPIALQSPLAIGRQLDGTLIVVDHRDPEPYVFVSREGALVRQRVRGSGSGNDGTVSWHQFTLGDAASPWTLRVEMASGRTLMRVYRGPLSGKAPGPGDQGEELMPASADDLRGLPVRNLPGGVNLEYHGKLAGDRTLAVTRPDDDWTYEDFRLFLGPPDRVLERKVSTVVRQRDGGTTDIRFDLDGAAAVAHFPAPSRQEPATLTVNGQTETITLGPMAPLTATFYCR